MSLPAQLLAKSTRFGRPPVTLEQHLADTEAAARRIFRPGSRLLASWARFFRLPSESLERWLLGLRIAALLHDVGKANQEFLAAVSGVREGQSLRHEHLSALVVNQPGVRAWLESSGAIDVDIILAAVLSHHLKASDPNGDSPWGQPRGATRIELYLAHAEIQRTLERAAAILGIRGTPALPPSTWTAGAPWVTWLEDGVRRGRRLATALRGDPARRALLIATKAGVIIADAAASALVREGHDFSWIDDVLHGPAIGEEEIQQAVLRPRAEFLARKSGRPFAYHRFQELAAEQGDRSLLLAACGAGKTMAAWRWAAACSSKRPVSRVVFLYPTRGTATEGFRDYVGWAPEAEAALVHGTARFDLDGVLENPPDSLVGKDPRASEADARLFALGLWPKRYFSATVDQFLGFLEHRYESLCLLPVLADCALVVDEVHSFDRPMFDRFVSFLRAFDGPVLAMTATLPPSRRADLVRAGLAVFPTDADRGELADLERAEAHPRYVIGSAVRAPALDEAVAAFQDGARVLVVVNTVRRCQSTARELAGRIGQWPVVYHSRFRLQDRRTAHGQAVSAFQSRQPAIAVTTQVCEMSLDLDADVLVTELAPIPSLVQRFGRTNRHLARGDAFRARIRVVEPESPLPYDRLELDAARGFLRELAGADVSQRGLAEALDRHARPELAAVGSARFLESGLYATEGAFRDVEERSRPCVLDDDLEEVESLVVGRKPIDGHIVPVPLREAVEEGPAWLPRFLRVAPSAGYDNTLGYIGSSEP